MNDSKPTPIDIDGEHRLSESKLWAFQQQYFDSLGIDAWAGSVPFYVTSNHVITRSYAENAFAFMRDYLALHPECSDTPFYMVELGTGSGQFSYYTLLHLAACMKRCDPKNRPKFCYVMTDFTQNNIKFWQQHPSLKPFVEQGVLDFAQFDMEKDQSIHLIHQNRSIDREQITNPLIVFANYIFDSVSNDGFKIQDQAIAELRVKLQTSADNVDENGSIKDLKNMQCHYSSKAINPNDYYDDKHLNDILKYYQHHVKNSHILLPIAGIRTINRLLELSNHRLLLISSDKAYTELHEMDFRNTPHIAFHGSFSLMVNYDAIVRYFHLLGGECVVPTPRQGLKTVMCLKGIKINTMPRLQRAISHHIESFSPSDYFVLYKHFLAQKDNLSIEEILSFLASSNWDPYVFNKFINRIMAILKDASQLSQNRLAAQLPVLDKHFYVLPNCGNTYFNIGVCYYILGDFKTALDYYLRAEHSHGPSANLYYNRALCFNESKQKSLARDCFKQALACDPDNQSFKEWIDRLS